MKKILVSLMMIALAGTMVGGGVFAAFSDVESSANNQFVAGTLDLEVDDENPWSSTKINVSDMKPGDSGVATMKLENTGSIDGTITVDITTLVDSAGITPEPEPTPDNGELSANMDIVIWIDTNSDGVKDAGETELYSGKLNAEAGPYSIGALAGSGTSYVSISYSIDNSVGNVIQGDSCTFTVLYNLNQA